MVFFVGLMIMADPGQLAFVQGYHQGEPYDLEIKYLPIRSEITGNRVRLDSEAAEAFEELLVLAAKDGHHLQVNYGFRTHEQQIAVERLLSKRGQGHLVATPGWSNHQQGLSLDIKGCTVHIGKDRLDKNPRLKRDVRKWHKVGACDKTDTGYLCKTDLYWWLRANAPRYGFTNDVSSEPWHWTFQKGRQHEVGG